jgi:segregation and condensation protein B
MEDPVRLRSNGVDELKGADPISEHGLREGEARLPQPDRQAGDGQAPSGFASGESKDLALPVRERGVGASEDSRQRTARASTDDSGDASPYSIEELELKSIVESLLFVSTEPLTLDQLCSVLVYPVQKSLDRQKLLAVLETLQSEYREMGRGLQLVEVAGGYQLVTRPENSPWIKQLHTVRMAARLSRPGLETLAIVTYRQPVTTPEIEAIRGVDCSGVLKTLLERRLIKIVGRKEAVGKPMLYGTTQEFLQHFGLRDLSELPPLKAVEEVAKESPELTEMSQDSLQEEPTTSEPAPSVG